MSSECPVPPELLYDILTHVLRDYFHEYILDEEKPSWNAPTTCLFVSRLFRDSIALIISHAMKITDLGGSEVEIESPRVVLAYLRHLAAELRVKPRRIWELLADTSTSMVSVKKRPYAYAYWAYLAAHSGRRHIMNQYPNTALPPFPDTDTAIAFHKDVMETARISYSALVRCDSIVPASICTSIGIRLTAENWRMRRLCVVAGMLPALVLMAEYVGVYIENSHAQEYMDSRTRITIDEGFDFATLASTLDDLQRQLTALYYIPEARVTEITREVLTEYHIVHRLQKLLASPSLQDFDPLDLATKIRGVLAQLGC